MCTIDGESFFTFVKNTWIGDSCAFCYIINDDTKMYYITEIDEPVLNSSGTMDVIKEGKLCLKARQVKRSEIEHTLWPVKYCKKVGANLFSLIWKLSQGVKLRSYSMRNILLDMTDSQIVVDQRNETRVGVVAGVNFT